MQVTVRYFDGCPNWPLAYERAQAALTARGRDPDVVRLERVATAAEAKRTGFRGSPTILIDGNDPFADRHAPVGLACRLYETPEGPAGSPTTEQILAALPS